MKRIYLLMILLLMPVAVEAQTLLAKPEEQARVKPLVAEMTKALETLNAKRDKLPEAKAVNDAKATYDKALEALNKATESMPERDAVKVAEAKVLDEVYRILAAHSLSSREFRPVFNAKGELAFAKIEPPKQ